MNSDPCRFRKISKLKPRPKKKLARVGPKINYGIFGPAMQEVAYLLVGAMSDDLVGLAAAYMRYQEGCSDNLKRSIRRKAEHMI